MTARRSYHHGNLREALVEAAADLIGECGPQGFTLAEAARRAGVSAAAPYRHYQGREELLAEVAQRGFSELGQVMRTAWDGGKPHPVMGLARMGEAYLDFALAQPAFYRAMFESGLAVDGQSAAWQRNEQGLAELVNAIKVLSAPLPESRRPDPRMVANHIWALAHGTVSLFCMGGPDAPAPTSSPHESLILACRSYLTGLGLIAPDFAPSPWIAGKWPIGGPRSDD